MPHQCTNCGRTFADGSKEMLSGCPDCSGTKFQFQPDGFDGTDGDAPDDQRSPGSGDVPDDGDSLDDGNSPDDIGGPTTPGSEGPNGGTVDRTASAGTDGSEESLDDLSSSRSETVSRTVGSAAATVRDLVGGSAGPDATAAQPPGGNSATDESDGAATEPDTGGGDDDIIVAESDPAPEEAHEDAAQADARSGFATADDLPDGTEPEASDSDETGSSSDTGADRTDVSKLDTDAETTDQTEVSEPDAETADRTEVSEPDAETADRPDVAELRKELNEQFESIRVVEPGQYELNLMELYDREEYIIALREDGRYSIQVPETWRDADV
jgi:predicted  nucleic acid-binding Zn-ribbon protein